ncbi:MULTISPECIES: hypothetical protein [unclassified Thiomonas]|nr:MULTISPECIES: hypothetical protein [unclassified Thiomonas]CAZ89689.1 hypothetical protein; putative exported protein [Thiomonas arsenitoxydans]CQR39143.1 conserved exported hypothetical protein [Thiomonas arsenitoxydans]
MTNTERRRMLSWLGGAGLLAIGSAARAADPVQDHALAVQCVRVYGAAQPLAHLPGVAGPA